jgi:hypothetical protein
MQCSYIPIEKMTLEQFTEIWLKVLPFVKKLVKRGHGRISEKSIFDEVVNREIHLWVVFDETKDNEVIAFIGTKVREYASKRLLSFDYIGGEQAEAWFDVAHDLISDWARTKHIDGGPECHGIEAIGRIGWVRFLKPKGWSQHYAIYEKMFERNEGHEQEGG